MHKYILILLAALILSCEKNNPVDSKEPLIDKSVIMPLKVGNLWIYIGTTMDTLKNITDVREGYGAYLTKERIINSEVWFFDDGGIGYTNRKEGLWNVTRPDDLLDTALVVKYPVALHDTSNGFIVVSIDSMITVPAGSFSCYVYKSLHSEGVKCYSPGIGLIYAEAFMNSAYSDDFYFKMELKSYTLK